MELFDIYFVISRMSSHSKDEQFSFARGVGLVIGVRPHRTCTRAQSDRVNCAPFNFHTSEVSVRVRVTLRPCTLIRFLRKMLPV